MRKALIILSLIMLISIMVGCENETKTPKQLVLDSIDKNMEIENMTYSGDIVASFDVSDVGEIMNEEQFLMLFNGFNITFNGRQIKDPFYMEMDMSILTDLQGMELVFEIPMIAKDNEIYIKVPNMFSVLMPEVNQEYLMMDISNGDQANYNADSIELFKTIVNDFDDSSFISEEKKSYNIDNVKIEDVISLNITQENLKSFLDNFIIDGLPDLIEYLDKYSIAEEQKLQLQQLKMDIDNNAKSIEQIVSDFNNKFIINNFKITCIYDKNELLRQTVFDLDIESIDANSKKSGFKINGEIDIDSINEGIQIEMQVPNPDQIYNFDNLNLSEFISE